MPMHDPTGKYTQGFGQLAGGRYVARGSQHCYEQYMGYGITDIACK